MPTISQTMTQHNLRPSEYPSWDRASRRNAARELYRKQPPPHIDPARITRDLAAQRVLKQDRMRRAEEERDRGLAMLEGAKTR